MLSTKCLPKIALALCAASLLLLTACSRDKWWLREVPGPERIVKQFPPDAYLQDCPGPAYIPGQPWASLPPYIAALHVTRDCDLCDKARLRAWRDGKPEPKCKAR